jgi:uncharacterized protein (DUF305 family)
MNESDKPRSSHGVQLSSRTLIICLFAIGMLILTAFTAGQSMSNQQLASSPGPAQTSGPDANMPGHRGDTMMEHHMSVSSEEQYLLEMIPHHQEAIDRATQLLEGTNRQEMRQFAQSIIAVQSAEVDQMRTWLAQWYPDSSASPAYRDTMRQYTGMAADELDQAFLVDMIHHHMTAVLMSRQLEADGLIQNADVQPFARTIASEQMREIRQMHIWLSTWFDTGVHRMGMA